MNKTVISVLVAGTVLVIGSLLYVYNKNTLNGVGEMREHNDNLAAHEISPGDVVKKVNSNKGVILLDVRTLEEYEAVHLKGALLLPVQELTQDTLNDIGLGEDAKDREIIIYCRSGARSQTAYNIMKTLGYTNIKSVSGGMVHWQEDNYPLTESGSYTGPTVKSEVSGVVGGGSKITIDRKLHNFGVIPQYGGTVETTFTITNKGNEILKVGTLTTSCSCTSARISETSIQPNESALLTVVFNPNLHEEPIDVFRRTVFIPSNDPSNPELEVSVQVDIAEGK
tara:strand:- start:382142 stop:382987 length:846 start_codon:yes stop_codon:yes gene_type:complete